MNEVIATSTILNLFWAVVAIVFMRGLLRYFDKQIGFDFAEWLNNAEDMGKAVYLGARIIAVAIVVSAIVS